MPASNPFFISSKKPRVGAGARLRAAHGSAPCGMAAPFSWNAAVLLRKQAAAMRNQATILGSFPRRDFFTVTWQSHLYFSFFGGRARSLIPPHHRRVHETRRL